MEQVSFIISKPLIKIVPEKSLRLQDPIVIFINQQLDFFLLTITVFHSFRIQK